MQDLIIQNIHKSKLLVEQHFHGAFGVNFSDASAQDVVYVAEKLIRYGIGGFFPTLVTDSVENIRHQISVIKSASAMTTPQMAKIMGVHIEGVFLNPDKKGVHDETLFLPPTIANYKLFEDDFIKIVTLAPELDNGGELEKYLIAKGVRVQAGHCVGADLSRCHGVTHLFNGMGGISHRNTQTALAALVRDDVYAEIIADGVHLSDDILKLAFKMKPLDKVILVSDAAPLAHGDLESGYFAGKEIFYDGERITAKDGTIAGSALLLNDIIKRLARVNMFDWKYVENVYEYHNIALDGCVYWDEDFNIVAVEKDGIVIYKE